MATEGSKQDQILLLMFRGVADSRANSQQKQEAMSGCGPDLRKTVRLDLKVGLQRNGFHVLWS